MDSADQKPQDQMKAKNLTKLTHRKMLHMTSANLLIAKSKRNTKAGKSGIYVTNGASDECFSLDYFQTINIHGWKTIKHLKFKHINKAQSEQHRYYAVPLQGYAIQHRPILPRQAQRNQILDPNHENELAIFGSKMRRNCKSLEDLSLDFNSYYSLSNEWTIALGQTIARNLKKIKKLSISFSGARKLTGEGSTELILELVPCLRALRQLSLNLSILQGFNDTQIKTLMYALRRNLKQATHLALQPSPFPSHPFENITNHGLKFISEGLSGNLTNLQSLSLDFSRYNQLTDSGLATLGRAIGENFGVLKKLCLHFNECPDVTDEGIIILAEQITKNSLLRQLLLHFSKCPSISDQGTEVLGLKIANHLIYLQNVDLDFLFTKTTPKGMIRLRSLLSFIKNIRIVGGN